MMWTGTYYVLCTYYDVDWELARVVLLVLVPSPRHSTGADSSIWYSNGTLDVSAIDILIRTYFLGQSDYFDELLCMFEEL
ncbi:hypothetical protein EMCRGX_G032609 [Ephydatia muelleri]|eukprot:Em0019g123a